MKKYFDNIDEFYVSRKNIFTIDDFREFDKKCKNTLIEHIKTNGGMSVCGFELTDLDNGMKVEVNEIYFGESGDLVIKSDEGVCYQWEELYGMDKILLIEKILKE